MSAYEHLADLVATDLVDRFSGLDDREDAMFGNYARVEQTVQLRSPIEGGHEVHVLTIRHETNSHPAIEVTIRAMRASE